MSLYQKVRPTSLGQIVGQKAAVSMLQSMLDAGKVPHAMLFSGSSGCGKTTAARIIAKALGASSIDIIEKNAASDNGIDMIRDIEAKLHLRSLSGKSRIYIIDESHAVSASGQRAMLKMLEDTPAHVYFILCTTNPEKLEKPLVNRCSHVKFGDISFPDLVALIERTAEAEGIKIPSAVKIAEAAQGSARQALVFLEQISHTAESEWGSVLDVESDLPADTFALVKDLYSGARLFPKHGTLIKDLPESEVERLRCAIMAYGATMIRAGRPGKAVEIMENFKEPFFYSKKSGFTLALAKVSP
jgi:DNA polymerase-3 subunit gamma/tau